MELKNGAIYLYLWGKNSDCVHQGLWGGYDLEHL